MRELWHIRNCSLFERLDPEQLEQLERWARIRTFPAKSAVFLPDDVADGALLLASGRVRICSSTPDGKQLILAFIEPGELFGELALIEPGHRDQRAEAVTESTVILLPGAELRAMMEATPHLSLGVTKLIGLRRRRIERRLQHLLFRTNRERLGHLLLELVEEYGRPHEQGVLLDLKISHQDLASIIGVTRESVTMLLGEMQLAGLVKVSRQRVVIRDLDRLANELETRPPAVTAPRAVRDPGPKVHRSAPPKKGVEPFSG